MRRHLRAAVDHYAALQARLNERRNLSAAEEAMLRNCYFAQGGAWFDMGEYRQAIDTYSTATNLYQGDPAALEAYVQIAHCYRRLARPFDARAMVEQAKTVLKNMPPDAQFDRTTRYSREEWTRLLDWMAAL
jgi:tetratricopeptide (TPR) repeat protein